MTMVNRPNTGGAEAIEGVVDEGSSGDRRHRFADAIPVGPQAAPMAGGDDAPLEDGRSRYFGHIKIFMRSLNSVTVA